MGGFLSSIIGGGQAKTPIKGFPDRIKNMLRYNSRGLFGVLVPQTVLEVLFDPNDKPTTVGIIWFAMFWFLLLQPIAIQPVGLMVIFALPMFGVISSDETCGALCNENIILMFLGGWLNMVLNHCGMDKRLASFFLCSGGDSGYTSKKILLKSMVAAFCLSAVCNRLMVTSVILENVLPPLTSLSSYAKGEANYVEFKAILSNAVAVSSVLGSMCFVHASLTTLQLKTMFCEIGATDKEFPDIFNYLQFSAYAVPTATIMFLLNIAYHMVLLKFVVEKKPMSNYSMLSVKNALVKNKSSLGKITNHEKVSAVFVFASLVCFLTRWSAWLNMGWSTFRAEVISPTVPGVKDATTAAIFVIALHVLPKDINFIKIFTSKTKNDLPPAKVTSGILSWKYIDKHTDYSNFLLIGASVALYKGVVKSGLDLIIRDKLGDSITGMDWNVGILIVVLMSVVLASVMSGIGAQAVLMPLIVNMAMHGLNKWPQRTYLAVLGVGIGTAFGFSIPFLSTTCYFCKTLGKVPLLKQAKYGVPSTIICGLILWLSLCFYAPLIWDPDDVGVLGVDSPSGEGGPTTDPPPPPPPPPPRYRW